MTEEIPSKQVDTTDLKNKFKARSIPLEQDFHDLIDMADTGRLAAGLSPAQDGTKNTASTGLIIDSNNRLAVKAKTNGGLDVATDGVSVKKGNGIDTSADGVIVKAKDAGGLEVASDGVSVKKGNGIDTSADAVTVKAKDAGGLEVATDGVSVKKGNGIDTSADGVTVKAKSAGAISVDADGVSVVASTSSGLVIDTSGLRINLNNNFLKIDSSGLLSFSELSWVYSKAQEHGKALCYRMEWDFLAIAGLRDSDIIVMYFGRRGRVVSDDLWDKDSNALCTYFFFNNDGSTTIDNNKKALAFTKYSGSGTSSGTTAEELVAILNTEFKGLWTMNANASTADQNAINSNGKWTVL